MEIERIRKEINELLENVMEHSSRYSDERPIQSLEISFVLTKINKMQESFAILKHLLELQEKEAKQTKNKERKTTIVQEEKEITVIESSKIDSEKSPVLEVKNEQSSLPKLIDALTLNDRYLYANELFNKDMNAFNNMVKSIDNISSLNEAKELLSSLGLDDENEHVLSFHELVERRFS